MRAAGTTTTPGIMHVAPPPPIPRLGGTTNGYHPWTGGESTNATFTATRRILPRSAHCHHFHDPMEAHKQLKTKMTIQTITHKEAVLKRWESCHRRGVGRTRFGPCGVLRDGFGILPS